MLHIAGQHHMFNAKLLVLLNDVIADFFRQINACIVGLNGFYACELRF